MRSSRFPFATALVLTLSVGFGCSNGPEKKAAPAPKPEERAREQASPVDYAVIPPEILIPLVDPVRGFQIEGHPEDVYFELTVNEVEEGRVWWSIETRLRGRKRLAPGWNVVLLTRRGMSIGEACTTVRDQCGKARLDAEERIKVLLQSPEGTFLIGAVTPVARPFVIVAPTRLEVSPLRPLPFELRASSKRKPNPDDFLGVRFQAALVPTTTSGIAPCVEEPSRRYPITVYPLQEEVAWWRLGLLPSREACSVELEVVADEEVRGPQTRPVKMRYYSGSLRRQSLQVAPTPAGRRHLVLGPLGKLVDVDHIHWIVNWSRVQNSREQLRIGVECATYDPNAKDWVKLCPDDLSFVVKTELSEERGAVDRRKAEVTLGERRTMSVGLRIPSSGADVAYPLVDVTVPSSFIFPSREDNRDFHAHVPFIELR